jgi:hypothetical protein
VRGDAAGKLDFAFQDMGQQQLKNIARPVRVYAWRPEAVADLPVPIAPPRVTTISPSAVAQRLSSLSRCHDWCLSELSSA